MKLSFTAAVLIVGIGAIQAQEKPPPRFGTSTNGVNVPVAVFDGSRVVTGLGPSDFELKDNDVKQTIMTADFSTLPVDLRLVFDTSGSISEADLEHYLKAMRQVAAALEPRDRCEIVTFDSRIAEAAAKQSPPVSINIRRQGVDGTAFFDAVTLAMLTVPTQERRQITIVLSDAKDTTSFFDESTMIEAAKNTDAVVYTVLPGDPKRSFVVSETRLQALSLLTGGRLAMTHESAVGDLVLSYLEEFRQTYVLRYDLTGVPIDGWHKIEVKVRGGYKTKFKLGYFGGKSFPRR